MAPMMRTLDPNRRRASDKIRQNMAQFNDHHIYHYDRYDCANDHCPGVRV